MRIIIRNYRANDLDACCSLMAQLARHHALIYGDPSIADHDPVQSFNALISDGQNRAISVGEADGHVVALADLTVSREEAEIEPIVVDTTYRGQGIGTALLVHAVSESKKRGIRFLSIKPVARNQEAIRLFVKAGFKTVGRIELFQDLNESPEREWKSGITVHGDKLLY